MKLWAALPKSRDKEGSLWVTETDGGVIYGPVRCRGEADNTGAYSHGNPSEDPTRPFGDHPYGVYKVVSVRRNLDLQKYGLSALVLDPLEGEALEAKQHGRTGLWIHGGALHEDGRLRETYGCLRVDNGTIAALALLVDMLVQGGSEVLYTCQPAS